MVRTHQPGERHTELAKLSRRSCQTGCGQGLAGYVMRK